MDIKKEYNEIFEAWNNNDSHNDIYHLILNWLTKYKDNIKAKKSAEDLLQRMEFDDLYNIVEDFIYGSKYGDIHEEMKL
jgi:hypothetical protein